MDNEELMSIKGGAISASLINSIVRFGTIILELGRSLGTIIIRVTKKTTC